MLHTLHDIHHCTLAARDGDIGSIHNTYFDDRHFTLRYFVVDTGKWLPGRKVLIAPEVCGKPLTASNELPVALTRDEVKHSPERGSDLPVSRQQETEVRKHYGWPLYWETYPAMGMSTAIGAPPPHRTETVAPEPSVTAAQSDPDLRSTREVSGYHIQANDGEIGHVEDFLLDDEDWVLRYMVVDTRNWLPGRKVLISPQWVEDFSWAEKRVFVNLKREDIKNSPEYDPGVPVDREYETRLYEYYRFPGYWL